MARSEYSRLRSIAEKRIDRLSSHGLASPGISFPKVSQLKSAAEKEAALNAVKSFLASGSTLREAAKNPEKRLVTENKMPAFLTEKQAKEAERRERRNARRRERYAQDKEKRDARNARRREQYRRKKILKELTDKQRALLKGAATLGVDIPTDRIKQFIEYMEYRFAQVQESAYYAMDKYTEDYQKILRNAPNSDDIVADFERFLSEREDNESLFDNLQSYDEDAMNDLWDEFTEFTW